MKVFYGKWLSAAVAVFAMVAAATGAGQATPGAAGPVGVVSNIKVLSDKSPTSPALRPGRNRSSRKG